jgi:tRNA modification GTPase
LIDTAGIREATDAIEQVGVERTHAKIRESALMVYVFDLTSTSPEDLQEELAALDDSVPRILLGNKIDEAPEKARRAFALMRPIWISAKTGEGVEELRKILLDTALGDEVKTDDTVVSNLRHYEALLRADQALADVLAGIQDTRSGEMVALDIRQSLDALGSITGEVTGEDVLDSIFSRFCIGK